jgi:hypothetical protein
VRRHNAAVVFGSVATTLLEVVVAVFLSVLFYVLLGMIP